MISSPVEQPLSDAFRYVLCALIVLSDLCTFNSGTPVVLPAVVPLPPCLAHVVAGVVVQGAAGVVAAGVHEGEGAGHAGLGGGAV